jgi:poly-gamma-glutamate synthesis protein (capsule biosynthesis protein)
MNSCSFPSGPKTGKTVSGSDKSSGGTGLDNTQEQQGAASSEMTEGSSANEVGSQDKNKGKTAILIKSPVPLFASASVSHEVDILFNGTDIAVEDAQVSGSSPGSYDIIVDVGKPQDDSGNFLIYCAVTGFYNMCDNISAADFKKYWDGSSETLSSLSEIAEVGKNGGKYSSSNYGKEVNGSQAAPVPSQGLALYLTEETKKILANVYGEPGNKNIVTLKSNELQENIAKNRDSFAIVPFGELRKELKVINIDGASIFDKDFSYKDYPFSFSIVFKGNNEEKAASLKESFENNFFSDMDKDKMAVVNMSGVTALVRGVANRMDTKGILYPGEKIADTLKNGDIIHTSNEISFRENCNAGQSGTTFCSKPEYIELLKSAGINLIELTGNHLNDFGSEYLEDTLKMYDELGWKYFGGGYNLALSKNPALYEINGNKIAFLGFNQFGPEYDWATRTSAGSAPPDNDYYVNKVKSLKEEGYNVIFTFQYEESYNYFPLDRQVEDFRMIRDAGADIVSGSQAHQPMGFEITKDSLICYGLGNLFFDQMQSLGTRQGIITKHIFYDGRYISTQLIPTIIDDYSQPRLMDETEKAKLLKSLFEASLQPQE